MIDSFVSTISFLTAVSIASFIDLASRPLNSSDSINLVLFVCSNAVSIVSTICLAGPSMSSTDTKSMISLPAIPVSLSCFNNEPITRSAATTLRAVQISWPLTVLVSSNSLPRYSSADSSLAFLPLTISWCISIAYLYLSTRACLLPFTASSSFANLSVLISLRITLSTTSSDVPPSLAIRSRSSGVVTDPVEPSSDPHSVRVRSSCIRASSAFTSDICAP